MPRTALLAIPLLLLAACDDATGPSAPEEARFRVTAEAFDLDPATGVAAVTYTVENGSSATIYLNGCEGAPAPWADRWEEERWVRFSTLPCASPLADVALGPGQTADGTYAIDEVGDYRLGLAIRAEDGGDEAWVHITPSFEVR